MRHLVACNGRNGTVDPVRRIGVSPLDGFGALVVARDVPHQLPGKVLHGSEDTTSDDIAFNLGEPDLDLV